MRVFTLEESPALVLHLCTSVQKGRVKGSPPTSKSSDFVVLPFVVKGVLLSLHIRFLNTGSVLPPTSRVTFTTWLRYKQLWLKSIDFFCGKLPIVLLDKTLITPLGLCRALLSSIELQFGLSTHQLHYMEKNPGLFSSKNVISFWLKKEDVNILDDMGVSKLLGNFILEVN